MRVMFSSNNIIHLLLFAFSFVKCDPNCPSGTIYNNQSGKCYAFISQSLDWNSANDQCRSYGGDSHLVNIKDGFINNDLADQTRTFYSNCTSDVWIGATDLQDGHTWQWTDASAVTYSRWAPDFPTNALLANCAAMLLSSNGNRFSFWINDNCFHKKSSICEISIMTSTPSPPTCPSPAPQLCPPYFQYNPNTDACYHIGYRPLSWNAAQDSCIALNSNLTSIRSLDENNFVFGESFWSLIEFYTSLTSIGKRDPCGLEQASTHYYSGNSGNSVIWIGFIDQLGTSPHTFRWIDGSLFDYTNFYMGNPNAIATRRCGLMYTDRDITVNGYWSNAPCEENDMRAFVCKKPAAH